MIGRALSSLVLSLFCATGAWAQLASQTALVGTVTDSDGLAVPGAQVVAVNRKKFARQSLQARA